MRRSVFETSFASSNSNRAFNVTRATNAINGVIVKPGETFSMNDTIGPVQTVKCRRAVAYARFLQRCTMQS